MKQNFLDEFINKISVDKIKIISKISIILLIISYLLIFIIRKKYSLTTTSCIWISIIYLTSIFTIVTYILYKNKTQEKIKSTKYICFFIILIIISTFLSSNIGKSFIGSDYLQEGLITYLAYLSLFLNCTIIKEKKYILQIIKIFSIVGCILSITTLIGYYLNLHLRPSYEEYRPFLSIFHNENHAAYYYMMTYVASIMLFYFSEKKNSYIYLATSIIILHNLILNNTMGCLLSVLCILILLIIYTIIKKKNIQNLLTILTIFFIVCTINYETILGHFSFIKTDIARIETNEVTEINQIGSNRLALWKYGIQFMLEKPLFGYGNENIIEQYEKYELPEYASRPHNEFIQIGAFFGIPALIVYLLFLFSVLFPILKNIKTIEYQYVITSFICVSYLISSFFGVSCFYTTPFLYIFLGITSNFNNIEKIENK